MRNQGGDTSTENGTVDSEAQALVATASQMVTGTENATGAALALAALQTNDPQQALMLLAASSASSSMETQETREENHMAQQQAEYRIQMVEENVNNSDHTYENRWSKHYEENKRLVERVQRLEEATKQLVALVVQMRGGDADQVSAAPVPSASSLQCEHVALAWSYLTFTPGGGYVQKPRNLVPRQLSGWILETVTCGRLYGTDKGANTGWRNVQRCPALLLEMVFHGPAAAPRYRYKTVDVEACQLLSTCRIFLVLHTQISG